MPDPNHAKGCNVPADDHPRYHWLRSEADTVADMGRRVVEVLDKQPHDTMYAGNKMRAALQAAVQALVYAGGDSEAEIRELVREAYAEATDSLSRADT